jgi:hypothetical protein
MAVTYTNEVILVFTEFKPTPVVLDDKFDPSYMMRGEYIRYWILESTEIAKHSDGETREYQIEMIFYFDTSRHETKKAFDDVYSDKKEHLKRLLDNNLAYTSSSTYRWHNLVITEDVLQSVSELEDIDDENLDETVGQRFLVTITRSNFR